MKNLIKIDAYSDPSANSLFGFTAGRSGARKAVREQIIGKNKKNKLKRALQLTTMASAYLEGLSDESTTNRTINYVRSESNR